MPTNKKPDGMFLQPTCYTIFLRWVVGPVAMLPEPPIIFSFVRGLAAFIYLIHLRITSAVRIISLIIRPSSHRVNGFSPCRILVKDKRLQPGIT